jgi:hypothetical protein
VTVVGETILRVRLRKDAVSSDALTILIDGVVSGTKIALGIIQSDVHHDTSKDGANLRRRSGRRDAEVDVDFHTTIES